MVFKKVGITLLILLLFQVNYAKEIAPVNLSENAVISLITIAPGEETYSIFGHSAIRVFDPVNKIDYTFNYGTFDFSTPYFYLKFVRGNLEYFMDLSTFRNSVRMYMRENRSVNEMYLNLTLSQKQQLFNDLIENYKPENRYYKYDFFFDNCATRIRDIIVHSMEEEYYFEDKSDFAGTSYRELLFPYIKHSAWLDLGINLALGLPADEKAEVWGSMYLPDHLKSAFEFAKYKVDKANIPFYKADKNVFIANKNNAKVGFSLHKLFTPFLVFLYILLLVILYTLLEIFKKKHYYWVDKILFGVVGLFGLVILLLWTATEHRVMNDNLNILWALPTHLFFVWFLGKATKEHFLFIYFLINAAILILVLVFWNIIPQSLHFALIPLIIALIIRSGMISLQNSHLPFFSRSAQAEQTD
jgi:hypothetical protein